MKFVKNILCVMLAVLIVLPMGAQIHAADTMVIPTSQEGLEPGAYYLDLDSLGLDEDTLAALKAARWTLDMDSLTLSAEFPEGTDAVQWDNKTILGQMRPAQDDQLEWVSVAVPYDTQYSNIEHREVCVDLSCIFSDYTRKGADIYINEHPEEAAEMSDAELEMIGQEYAIKFVDDVQASDYWRREGDPLFSVKKVKHLSNGETKVSYLPFAAMVDPELLNEADYIYEYHDYYWAEWVWIDMDHAYALVECYFDGIETDINVRVDAGPDDIVKEIVRNPTETTDGEAICTATVKIQGRVFTNTETMPVPATGDVERVTATIDSEGTELYYPQGATYHVVVDKPELVVSYQWQIKDSASISNLDGTSATTDTLVLPATTKGFGDCEFRCVITDINGNKSYSQFVTQKLLNNNEDKPVLYVGDYALEPGQTLDLSTTPLGSGIVTFDADGINMTFDNVNVDARKLQFDSSLGASRGIFFEGEGPTERTYYMHFIGDNEFYSNYFDESRNNGGVIINAFFASKSYPVKPTVVLDGDGHIYTQGGANSIYSEANIEIDIDITTKALDGHFNYGITGYNLTFREGVNIDVHSIGCGIFANNDLTVEDGVTINIDSIANYIPTDNTEAKSFQAFGSMYLGKADITIKSNGDPEQLVPRGKAMYYYHGIHCVGDICMDGTNVDITMGADPSEVPYAARYCGVFGEPLRTVSLSNGAKLNIKIDSEYIYDASGISMDVFYDKGGIILEDESELNIYIRSKGIVIGIDGTQPLKVTDSDLNIDVQSLDQGTEFGVISPLMEVDINSSEHAVKASCGDGLALFIGGGDIDESEYDPDYEPVFLILKGKSAFTSPESGVVSPYGFEIYEGAIVPGEAVYDSNDPAKPMASVEISVEPQKYTVTYDLNGGTLNGKTGKVTKEVEEGEEITLPTPTRKGYTFDYWKGSKYKAGDKYAVKEDHTFVAQWKKNTPSTPDTPSTPVTPAPTTPVTPTPVTPSSGGQDTPASDKQDTPKSDDSVKPAPEKQDTPNTPEPEPETEPAPSPAPAPNDHDYGRYAQIGLWTVAAIACAVFVFWLILKRHGDNSED